jgi:thiol-disulfide isomerase/thioredoxin
VAIGGGPDRRAILGGMLAGLACPAGLSAAPIVTLKSGPRLFAGTPLGHNRLALTFEKVDLPLPPIKVSNGAAKLSLDSLNGKTRIVTLWAEWCAPCLVEARDFAALRRRFAGPTFDIVAVLTGSAERLDFAGATARLTNARVAGLPLLVEPNGGKRLMLTLSPSPFGGGGSLPCTLLVDSRGRIRGRSRGALTAALPPGAAGKPAGSYTLTEADKRAMLAGDRGTLWQSPDGDVLVTALRDGVLDRL